MFIIAKVGHSDLVIWEVTWSEEMDTLMKSDAVVTWEIGDIEVNHKKKGACVYFCKSDLVSWEVPWSGEIHALMKMDVT